LDWRAGRQWLNEYALILSLAKPDGKALQARIYRQFSGDFQEETAVSPATKYACIRRDNALCD
jgi:hypothetical protein